VRSHIRTMISCMLTAIALCTRGVGPDLPWLCWRTLPSNCGPMVSTIELQLTQHNVMMSHRTSRGTPPHNSYFKAYDVRALGSWPANSSHSCVPIALSRTPGSYVKGPTSAGAAASSTRWRSSTTIWRRTCGACRAPRPWASSPHTTLGAATPAALRQVCPATGESWCQTQCTPLGCSLHENKQATPRPVPPRAARLVLRRSQT